jgi:hypothetical protein
MSSLFRIGVTLAAMLAGAAAATAQPRPTVIELFTSEGCSSCPPAEAYIGELARRTDVIPLAFHVDYWDDLGWRDRFALAQATQRQSVYARTLRRSTVYTPQIVIDGRVDYVGSNRSDVAKALGTSPGGVPVGIDVRDGQVSVELGAQPGAAASDVVLVSYLRKAVSAIGRGENAGRTLEEYNIVRHFQTLGRWNGQPQSFHVALSSMPSDATDVAVIVQQSGQAPIIGAATRSLR